MFRCANQCALEFVPETSRLLKLLLTLPSSVASAERLFSMLRRLKTWLRSTVGQARMTGLAVFHANKVHLENIDTKQLCKDFVSKTVEHRKIFGL